MVRGLTLSPPRLRISFFRPDRLGFAGRSRRQRNAAKIVAVAAIDVALVDRHALARHPRQVNRDDLRFPPIAERLGRVGDDDVGTQARRQGCAHRDSGGADMHEA